MTNKDKKKIENQPKNHGKMENANNNEPKKAGVKSLFNTVSLEINAFDLLELQYVLEFARERMKDREDHYFYDLKKIASLYARCEELAKEFKQASL